MYSGKYKHLDNFVFAKQLYPQKNVVFRVKLMIGMDETYIKNKCNGIDDKKWQRSQSPDIKKELR